MESGFDRKLVLEDGSEYYGRGFGGRCGRAGSLLFCTAMTGCQELISDPGCTDQLVVLTYPLIGGTGIADDDFESKLPAIAGLVVREYNDSPSNFRYTKTLAELLEENDIPAIEGVDTRMLARNLRDRGCCRALLCTAETPKEEALARLRASEPSRDLVARVSCKKRWYARTYHRKYDVVAVDCGIKLSVIRQLGRRGCNVTVVPWDTAFEVIESMKPDGVLISSGPGAPDEVPEVVALIRKLRGRWPLFGIGLGHQLIALACGARIYRMRFGHHGGSYPVRDVRTGRIDTTSQGHAYAVDPASVEGTGLEITHMDLMDDSVEGLACPKERILTVQFHPEGAPGPDCPHIFEQFVALMKEAKEHA